MDLISEAAKMLEKCDVVSLSSVSEDGFPRVCVMAKINAGGIKTVYFVTGNNSRKVAHYTQNPKAGVSFNQDGDSVTLLGKITIIEDKAVKDALWQDWFIKHMPEGKDDPNYAVIRFDACEATIYIKDRFETVKL